jgi:hypothetical protein
MHLSPDELANAQAQATAAYQAADLDIVWSSPVKGKGRDLLEAAAHLR